MDTPTYTCMIIYTHIYINIIHPLDRQPNRRDLFTYEIVVVLCLRFLLVFLLQKTDVHVGEGVSCILHMFHLQRYRVMTYRISQHAYVTLQLLTACFNSLNILPQYATPAPSC